MGKCQQTTASDLAFYDIFAPQKVPFLKISDDVIACDLWFEQWWASYFLKVTSYKLQLLGKKVTKLQLQI